MSTDEFSMFVVGVAVGIYMAVIWIIPGMERRHSKRIHDADRENGQWGPW